MQEYKIVNNINIIILATLIALFGIIIELNNLKTLSLGSIIIDIGLLVLFLTNTHIKVFINDEIIKVKKFGNEEVKWEYVENIFITEWQIRIVSLDKPDITIFERSNRNNDFNKVKGAIVEIATSKNIHCSHVPAEKYFKLKGWLKTLFVYIIILSIITILSITLSSQINSLYGTFTYIIILSGVIIAIILGIVSLVLLRKRKKKAVIIINVFFLILLLVQYYIVSVTTYGYYYNYFGVLTMLFYCLMIAEYLRNSYRAKYTLTE